ncbi:muconolactone Delta-isomerase [Amycolatopsis jejuensis]|uniref:muconolactone Delta-isomerase n=1 Tax=Amycolatopsis jejuensis TaxID=330084 RepID=UPI0005272A1B|nr:muconolactone Delta-isomerase [Amycolatopsis jejuensis]
MLYHVRMDVRLPPDLDPAARADLLAREKAYSQQLQRTGKWPHLWRIAGEYANFSVLDVDSHDELHELLSNLPLFPYMDIHVTPLAKHPSKVD